MELDNVRYELDKFDNIIKNMIVLRMSLIPIVTDIKIKNGLPLFQAKREEAMYKKIEEFTFKNGISTELVVNVYKQIIAGALDIEHNISDGKTESILNSNSNCINNNLINEFEKLDNLLINEIPNILNNITNIAKENNLNLNEISSLYYNNKINK